MKYLDKLAAALPAVMVHESAKWDQVYQVGALSAKVKRLVALGIALRACCEHCIVGFVKCSRVVMTDLIRHPEDIQ